MGAEVKVCGPSTLIPKYIESLGIKVEFNLMEVLNWCDVANVLRIQTERQELQFFPSAGEYANFFGITKKTLDQLKKKVVLMHPGPINRGVELSTDAADSEYSIILDQVQNGVAIRMSVLYLLANSN
jgi:aspartate carbamoyltransferase catalytic subunit